MVLFKDLVAIYNTTNMQKELLQLRASAVQRKESYFSCMKYIKESNVSYTYCIHSVVQHHEIHKHKNYEGKHCKCVTDKNPHSIKELKTKAWKISRHAVELSQQSTDPKDMWKYVEYDSHDMAEERIRAIIKSIENFKYQLKTQIE